MKVQDKVPEIAGILEQAVQAGDIPGAVVCAGTWQQQEMLVAVGAAEVDPRTNPDPASGGDPGATPLGLRPAHTETRYDIASLTKVTSTLPVILRLVADGKLDLDTRVVEVIPEFDSPRDVPGADPALAAMRRGVTVSHLLTHSSGLPASREFYKLGLGQERTLEMFLTEPLEVPPATRVAYSDLGFVTLGVIAERIGGARLDALFAEIVAQPLKMTSSCFGPVSGAVASTERNAMGVAKTGVVHDENCETLGGVAGHAGLFATAADLGRYAAAWTTDDGSWLPEGLLAASVKDHTARLGGHRGLGWTCRGDVYDQLGPDWPDSGVFHSGFTGTGMAIDRPSGRWVILLTNAVHFGRGKSTNPLRHRVHSALAP